MFSLSETGFNKRLDISEEEISKLDNVAIQNGTQRIKY